MFAILKKYQSKCDQWVGFGWDLTSPRTVEVAFFMSEPWSYDEQMEQLARNKLRLGQRGLNLDFGRNPSIGRPVEL